MQIEVTPEKKEELELRHRKTRDGGERDRIKAVLLRAEGWSLDQIAQALRIHLETVRDHLRDYSESEKLKPENGGSTSKLNEAGTLALIAHLEATTYLKVVEICAYVAATYGVTYTVSGMTAWLRTHGFSYKKPAVLPAKADAAQQAAFIETYEKLMNTTPLEAPILFGDGVHPTMATKVTHGWIKKGARKPILTTAGRTRINVMGSLDLERMALTTTTHQTLDAQAMEDPFRQLRKRYPGAPQLHLILDRGAYNRSPKTREAAKKHGIVIHLLPSYSPNLNPIERCWKVMNEHVRNNRFFASAQDFEHPILHVFKVTWPKIAHTLRDRINDNFQKIPSASSS